MLSFICSAGDGHLNDTQQPNPTSKAGLRIPVHHTLWNYMWVSLGVYIYMYMQQRDCWILVYACLISESIATMENSMEVP